MSISDDIRAACAPRDWQDSLAAIRRQHGRGTSRWIAEHVGISQRQAQRWLAGQVQHSEYEDQVEDLADPGWLVADALASAGALDVGRVEVFYDGKSQGTRNVGTLVVDEEMHGLLTQAGALYAEGMDEQAEAIISDAILGGYTRARDDNRYILAGTLSVGRFQNGFRII
jgi:hypothetical protein